MTNRPSQKLRQITLILLSVLILCVSVACASSDVPVGDDSSGIDRPVYEVPDENGEIQNPQQGEENDNLNSSDEGQTSSDDNTADTENEEGRMPAADEEQPDEPDADDKNVGEDENPDDNGEQSKEPDGEKDQIASDDGEQPDEPDDSAAEEQLPPVDDSSETGEWDSGYSDENAVWHIFCYDYDESNVSLSGFKTAQDSVCIEIADAILNGTLYVAEALEGYPCVLLKNLDWNISYSSSPNTFQLYLQGLTPLEVLCRAYWQTGNIRYLECGWDLILSWLQFEADTECSEGNGMLWNDHTAAIRTESLLFFMLSCEGTALDNASLRSVIYDQLVIHAEFLADDANYTENHNHGIIQDVALLHTAYFIEHAGTKNWIDTAVSRLYGQLAYAFNEEMVHVENSPGYNEGVIDLFYEIGVFLETMENPEGQALMQKICDAAEFLAWVTMPNGIAAQIGDTAGKSALISYTFRYVKYGNNRLNFAASMGKMDEMSTDQKIQDTKYYPDAGYFFYRENWNADQITEATWKMFKAGYSSRTHKHSDDLSFMMYSKGYEVFTDSGWYNYMSGVAFREYVISSSAHNVVTVDEKSYSPTEENAQKTGMLSYTTTPNLDTVLAYNNMYNGVQIDRWFYSSGDLTILYDNILSDETHTYSQLFHLSEYISVVSQSDREIVLSIADTGYYVRIRQLTPVKLEVYSGKTDGKPMYGHISRTMNNMDEIVTLRFVAEGSNVDFVTVITIEDEYGMVKLKNGTQIHCSDISCDSWDMTANFAGETIAFTARTRPQLNVMVIVEEGHLLKVKAFPEGKMLYAWYVIDAVNAKVLYKTGMTDNPEFSYDLAGIENDVLIKGYAQTREYSQRNNGIVAALIYDSETGRYRVDQGEKYPYLNLEHNGNYIEKVSDRVYRFHIDFNYSWSSTQRWYVYRNGSYYTVLVTKNQHVLEYEFTEPGEYTVMYYLKTPNGDNEFWDFEIISVP